MKLLYFFDDYIKPIFLKGTKYCNPQDTTNITNNLLCIRQYDVNFYLYSKNDTIIAFDSGHLNFKNMGDEFKKIDVDNNNVSHVFLTHADVDHAGGIDVDGKNIFPNAQVYLGTDEEQYLNNNHHRMVKLGFKLNNCVKIKKGYTLINDEEHFNINGIKIDCFHIPGHTLGHFCYIIDDEILITGDCLAVNKNGGYSFFDFFTQYPDLNKKSLHKLESIVNNYNIKYVCTGHSGVITDLSNLFKNIDTSATFSKNNPFDEDAPYDFKK